MLLITIKTKIIMLVLRLRDIEEWCTSVILQMCETMFTFYRSMKLLRRNVPSGSLPSEVSISTSYLTCPSKYSTTSSYRYKH